MMRRIVHLTTVHPFHDNRIWEKMVKSCAEAGLETHYISQPPVRQLKKWPHVRLHYLPAGASWASRAVRQFLAFYFLVRIGKSIVHYHDPELQPLAWLLLAMGYQTIYDVHEDNVLAIRQKEYLPRPIRGLTATIVGTAEALTRRLMPVIIAERCYSARFPRSFEALNYPSENNMESLSAPGIGRIKFIYTGVVSVDRGAENMISLLLLIPACTLTIVGSCSDELHRRLIDLAGPAASRLFIEAPSSGVPFSVIKSYYAIGGWSAGLAIFPSTPHYRDKELTKLFEYMQHGIPIICSDFPRWKEIVDGNDVGMTIEAVSESSADRIRSELASPSRISRWGKNGTIAATRYTWKSQFQNVLSAYELTRGRKARARASRGVMA